MPLENSRALPMSFYRDPAEVCERQQLRELGCLACKSHTRLLGKVVCTDARKSDNKNVPRIGSKCKYFELGA
ncbi:MAG: hypothetical protein Q8M99_11775 [Methylotenera sp.]|nr:hypothetical protein [Methylotenera sp.]